MKENLRDLLDKIYELEGLIHLTLKREDNKEDFLRLIVSRGKEIGRICDLLEQKNLTSSHSTNESEKEISLDEYSIDDETNKPHLEILKNEIYESEDDKSEKRHRGKLVFTINERYRFKRDLFENSDADFNNTLAVVASMENYDEAEEYFISEEGFNMGNPVVKEFLEIIKKYFK